MAGLLAALTWGAADFTGGVASRRASALTVVLGSQVVGGLLAAGLAVARTEVALAPEDAVWSAAAGLGGGIALAGFYRGLAVGRMGVVAPITGVLAAAVPVVFGAVLEGLPQPAQLVGIGCALAAVVLVSWSAGQGGGDQRTSVILAVLAGGGFGMFYVLIDRVSADSLFWPLVAARIASVSLMTALVVGGRLPVRPLVAVLPLVLIAGVLDLGGNAFFLLGAQAGRLDVASVLASLYPITTVALAALLLRERIGRLQAVGVVAAVAAIVLIASG